MNELAETRISKFGVEGGEAVFNLVSSLLPWREGITTKSLKAKGKLEGHRKGAGPVRRLKFLKMVTWSEHLL